MPITQARMLSVLDESDKLARWASELRSDILRALGSPTTDGQAKLDVIRLIVMQENAPACIQCAIERDHFRRAARRNESSARRMRAQREKENEHELD